MKILAPAKINFGLWIGAKRDDGYHPVSTVYIPVSLYDIIHLNVLDRREILLEISNPAIPGDANNLCWKAAELFLSKTGVKTGVRITLEKVIPVEAGLGGGSSDAAAVLSGLSSLLQGAAVTKENLHSFAVQLGADVPFFLEKHPCAASGTGEMLQPVTFPWKCSILLVIPSYSIATADAYSAFDLQNKEFSPLVGYAEVLSSLKSLHDARKAVRNDFEPVLFPRYPELKTIKQTLYDAGADYASLTGSGSAMYGMFESEETARSAESVIKNAYRIEMVKPLI